MSVTGVGAVSQAPQTASGVASIINTTNDFLLPHTPNVVDFLWWLNTSVQIPPAALPVSSQWPQYALWQALELVLREEQPRHWPHGNHSGSIMYVLACYNCSTHLLLSITPDVPGQNFFASARGNGAGGYSLVNPSTGIIAATSDESTSATLASPDWAKRLTIGDLDFFKTPWGRYYLNYNQSFGTLWGLT